MNLLQLASRLVRLQREQWLAPTALEQRQDERVRHIVHHAYQRVPYYRRLMDAAGVHPDQIRGRRDLLRIPVSSKQRLLQHPERERLANNTDPAGCLRLLTSGSEGMPFEALFRPEDKALWALQALRGWLANRFRPTFEMLIISDSRTPQRNPQGRWLESLGLFRRHYTSVFDPSQEQARLATALAPQVLRGMPSDLLLLAEGLEREGLDALTPRLVITSAELLDPHTRQRLQSAFGVDPVDFYGAIECGWIAWQCAQRVGYHVNADCLVVELLRDGEPVAPGEPGEVVITNLGAYAMPFIRYSLGDLARFDPAPCRCGRGLPLLHTLEGRSVDCITLADGRRISPYQLTCTVEKVSGIQRYQLVQGAPGRLTLKVLPSPDFSDATLTESRAALIRLLGDTLQIEVRQVKDLGRSANGKFRVVAREDAVTHQC